MLWPVESSMKPKRLHEPYAALVAKYGKPKAQKIALEAIRRKHPPKRERIVIN